MGDLSDEDRTRQRKGMSLIIRNLPRLSERDRVTVACDKIRDLFERHGPVRDVYLPVDYSTGIPRGFCFVEFTNDEDAEDAMRCLDGYMFEGKELSVTLAKQGRRSPESMRRREMQYQARLNHQRGRGDYRHRDDDYDGRRDDYRRDDNRRDEYRRDDYRRDYDDRRGHYSSRGYRNYSRSRSPGARKYTRRSPSYDDRRTRYDRYRDNSPQYRSESPRCSSGEGERR